MKVLHVVGKEMQEIDKEGDKYTFLDGDVYVVDNHDDIWIWIGKDCAVEEQTVGAWVANKLDNEDRGGEPNVFSTTQGDEPEEFTKLVEFNVKDGDTPGFLVHAELDIVEYKLFRVYVENDTENIDDASITEVPLSRDSLSSDDVFVLDGNEKIYTWIGKSAQREEKYEGQKLSQAIDSERNYTPLSYTIYEGEGGKSEEGFYEMIEILAKKGSDVSVEDQRELTYRPEGGETPEEARKRQLGQSDSGETKEKKGFFAKLLSFFR